MTAPLGTLPVGCEEPAAIIPGSFARLYVPATADAVILVEATPTDGELTVVNAPLVLGASPVGIMPGSITGGEVHVRWSDRDWTSGPADEVPDAHFEGRAGEISVTRSIPIEPGADRRIAAAMNDILLDNADGELDETGQHLAIDGRPVTLSLLDSRSSSYAERRVLFSGVGRAWRSDVKSLHLMAVSAAYLLDVPMLGLYGGTGGQDGGPDLAGKPIIEVLGLCRGVPLQLVDDGLLIYRVHAREVLSVDAVYVRGQPRSAGSLRASYAALEAATVSSGAWDSAITPTGTYIRLGSGADGTVTADVHGDAPASYTQSIAGMMRALLTRAGAAIADGTFTAAYALAPGAAGIVFTEQLTYAAALTQLAASAAFWWGDAGDGRISVGRLGAPQGNSGLLIDEEAIRGEVDVLDPPAPLWRVVANYRRNWTPLSPSDCVPAPTITEARRSELLGSSFAVPAALPQRRTRNALAGTLTIDTLFDEEADALVLANNLLSLYAPGRSYRRVPVGLAGQFLRLGQEARVKFPRSGFSAGQDVRVVGQELRGRDVTLLVFG